MTKTVADKQGGGTVAADRPDTLSNDLRQLEEEQLFRVAAH
jgi:hypothetical protein